MGLRYFHGNLVIRRSLMSLCFQDKTFQLRGAVRTEARSGRSMETQQPWPAPVLQTSPMQRLAKRNLVKSPILCLETFRCLYYIPAVPRGHKRPLLCLCTGSPFPTKHRQKGKRSGGVLGFSQLCRCVLPHGLRAEPGLPHSSNELLYVDEHRRKQQVVLY